MSRDDSTLPAWIPIHARYVYSDTGPYSDPRMEAAAYNLFHSEGLKDFFVHLERLRLTCAEWEYFASQIISAVECVPPDGAATKDRSDLKVRIRCNQAAADALLVSIARKAHGLADLLNRLNALGAEIPGETYSSLALIESALTRNIAADDFKQFRRGLSSYRRSGFPATGDLLTTLAESAERHPKAMKIFQTDPWLRSQKSTWRDFVSIVFDSLAEIHLMYGTKIELREKHWVALVHALLSDSISRSSISDALKEFKA